MTVVVGVNSSPYARAALAWAAVYARRAGSRVLAVSAWQPQTPMVDGMGMGVAVAVESELLIEKQLQAEADRTVKAAVAELASGAEELVEVRVARGDPATVLCAAAEGAELLVLGNHGRSALVAAVVGSVATRCVHHAHCPVVLVPAPPVAAP